jgi:hypothetical protein
MRYKSLKDKAREDNKDEDIPLSPLKRIDFKRKDKEEKNKEGDMNLYSSLL